MSTVRDREPTDPAARVIDFNGDVWVSYEGLWYRLRNGPGPSWDELCRVFGPVEVLA